MNDHLMIDAKLAIAFRQLDAGNKGFVTRADLMAIADQLCIAFDQPHDSPKRATLIDAAEHFWAALIRADGSIGTLGCITLEESQYKSAMRRLLSDDHHAFHDYLAPMMIAMLSIADFDDDGLLGRDEFCAWQIIMGTRVQDVAQVFGLLDRDSADGGDGYVSIDEIMAAVWGFYGSSDTHAWGNFLFGQWRRTTLNMPTV